MKLREQDKHFLLSIVVATGIILFWKGIWEGIGGLPVIGSPWVSLFVGFAILTFSGILFKEFDPLGGLERTREKMMQMINEHPKKHEFHIIYHDKIKKQDIKIHAKDLKGIEKNFLVISNKSGQELFVPIHRVKEILHNSKSYWKY